VVELDRSKTNPRRIDADARFYAEEIQWDGMTYELMFGFSSMHRLLAKRMRTEISRRKKLGIHDEAAFRNAKAKFHADLEKYGSRLDGMVITEWLNSFQEKLGQDRRPDSEKYPQRWLRRFDDE